MLKAVVFDCFGVIISDSLEARLGSLRPTDPDMARQVSDVVTAANRGFMDLSEAHQRMAGLLDISLEEFDRGREAGEVKDEVLLHYVLDLRRRFKTGLLSNISRAGLQERFTAAELADHFDAAVTSGDIGYAKPEPAAYEAVADRLGVRLDECLMVDDREVCVEGARSVGMRGHLYTGLAALQAELADH